LDRLFGPGGVLVLARGMCPADAPELCTHALRQGSALWSLLLHALPPQPQPHNHHHHPATTTHPPPTKQTDQRGCGRSAPRGCLVDNTTAALVSDLEALRAHLGVPAFATVLGGSWGVALALAYAQSHPDRIRSLVLRGVCCMRPHEVAWVYAPARMGGGAAAMRPAQYAGFVGALEEGERANPVLGYYKRMLDPDASVREAAVSSGWGLVGSVGGGFGF